MKLTEKQQMAVQLGRDRYLSGEKATIIAGLGGSGKTTVLKHIIEATGVSEDEITYASYTGKAALVLRQKGHPAQTLHKLLYDTRPIENKETQKTHFIFNAKKKLEKPYKIVVVDELSMVPMEMMQLLFKYPVHIIALGDPGQLPPLFNDNGLLNNPHIFLDEVMRQEEGSEILDLSLKVRSGKRLELFNGVDVKVIDRKDIVDGMYLWADVVICGRNTTRRQINHKIRGMRGATSLTPEPGDKLVCLRNYWESESDMSFDPLINGMIGYASDVGNPCPITGDIPIYFQPDYTKEGDGFGTATDVNIYNWLEPRKGDIPHNKKVYPPAVQMDYGYAITCHKSQGSEFEKVMVLEECLNSATHVNWLYTAITRATKKLIVVRNY